MSDVWMPLYIGDYLRDTSRLSTQQHGAYMLLLMDYWVNKSLPDDDEQLANIARVPRREWDKMKPAIERLFLPGWKHKRVESELAKAAEISRSRRDSAGKRWGKGDANADAIADANGDAKRMHRARAIPQSPSPSAPAAKAAAAGPPPLDLNELRRACVEAAGQDFTKGFGMIAELAEAGHSVEDRIVPIIREAAADLATRGEKARSWAYFAEAIMDEHRAAPAAPAPLVEHVWCEKGTPEFERGNAARVARGEAPWSGFPSRHHNGAVGASFPASDVREERAQA